MVRRLYFTSIMLTLFLPISGFSQVSLEYFTFRTEDHRNRIEEVAVALLDIFPEYFGIHLSEEVVRKRLFTHDLPKMMSLKELKEYGYPGDRTIGELLAESWGLPEADRGRVIDWLNHIEEIIREGGNKGLDTMVVYKLDLLERLVDVVDTALYRTDEFGVFLLSSSASAYLQSTGKKSDLELADMAAYLQPRYVDIIERGKRGRCRLALSDLPDSTLVEN